MRNRLFIRDRLVEMDRIDFILKSGRAVLWPIYKGTYERQDGVQTYFPNTSIRYRDWVIQWAKDLRRSIDYLETRAEIDMKKLAFYGFSWGACMGAIMPAVEDRLSVSVLMGPGLYLEQARPEVDQINFAPRVRIPTLIVDGRDDFVFPRELSQEPFYRLLGTHAKHKRLRRVRRRSQCAEAPLDSRKSRLAGSISRSCRGTEAMTLRHGDLCSLFIVAISAQAATQPTNLCDKACSTVFDGRAVVDPSRLAPLPPWHTRMPCMSWTAGTEVSGYEIKRLLGAGGMGEVYLARNVRLQRDVALKVLPPSLISGSRAAVAIRT